MGYINNNHDDEMHEEYLKKQTNKSKKETMSELVKVDYKEYGIEESKATEMTSGLQAILAEREELKKSYTDVIELEITEENLSTFKELRLKIRDNRTKGIDAWHKVNKDFYLRGGQFIDAIKRKENLVNEQMEEKLQEAEKFFENQEKKRIAELQETRLKLISEYVDDTTGLDLGNMHDEVFEGFLNLKKTQKAEREEAERVAEEKRIEEEKAEALRIETERLAELEKQKAIQAENDRLKKEQEAKDELRKTRSPLLQPYIVFIRDYNTLIDKPESEFVKEFTEIKKGAEFQWEQDRKEKENELARIEKEAKIKAENEAKLKAEEEANKKAEEQKKEAEKLAKAPIKNQLTAWIETFQNEIPENLKDDKVANDILSKFWSFKSWAKSEIEKI